MWQTVITKCDRLLLQSAPGITKCDRLLLQSASGITKCDSYYKVRCNRYLQSLIISQTCTTGGRGWGWVWEVLISWERQGCLNEKGMQLNFCYIFFILIFTELCLLT